MTETIPYEVTGKTGEVEFRLYSPVVLATVEDDGEYSGFRLLFAYITGSNRPRNTIPMTAPVITSEQIPMTAPVISGPVTMSFVMPPGRTRDDIPEPTDERVRIEEVQAREVAVIRFSGHAHEDDVEAIAARLFEELGKGRRRHPGHAVPDAVQRPVHARFPPPKRGRGRDSAVMPFPSAVRKESGRGEIGRVKARATASDNWYVPFG